MSPVKMSQGVNFQGIHNVSSKLPEKETFITYEGPEWIIQGRWWNDTFWGFIWETPHQAPTAKSQQRQPDHPCAADNSFPQRLPNLPRKGVHLSPEVNTTTPGGLKKQRWHLAKAPGFCPTPAAHPTPWDSILLINSHLFGGFQPDPDPAREGCCVNSYYKNNLAHPGQTNPLKSESESY